MAAYSGSGVTATVTIAALAAMGREAASYPGSWSANGELGSRSSGGTRRPSSRQRSVLEYCRKARGYPGGILRRDPLVVEELERKARQVKRIAGPIRDATDADERDIMRVENFFRGRRSP